MKSSKSVLLSIWFELLVVFLLALLYMCYMIYSSGAFGVTHMIGDQTPYYMLYYRVKALKEPIIPLLF